jgi:hypothetical protein
MARPWIAMAFILCIAPCLSAKQQLAARCPNLSGHYMIQGEDGQVHIYVQQNACDRIVIERRTSYLGKITSEKHSLRLDGKPQVDMAWLGQPGKVETSAKFDGDVLRVVTKAASTDSQSTMKWNYSLTARRNLLEDLLLNDQRHGGPLEAARQ